MIFLNLLHMRDMHSDFQPAIFKTVNYSVMGAILPPGTFLRGGVGGGELNFLDPLHMRNTHSDFQLLTSKTDLTYYPSKKGAILPHGTLPLRDWGEGLGAGS